MIVDSRNQMGLLLLFIIPAMSCFMLRPSWKSIATVHSPQITKGLIHGSSHGFIELFFVSDTCSWGMLLSVLVVRSLPSSIGVICSCSVPQNRRIHLIDLSQVLDGSLWISEEFRVFSEALYSSTEAFFIAWNKVVATALYICAFETLLWILKNC